MYGRDLTVYHERVDDGFLIFLCIAAYVGLHVPDADVLMFSKLLRDYPTVCAI
jgi:hypothetical protein